MHCHLSAWLLALVLALCIASTLGDSSKTKIKMHRHGHNRPEFMQKECTKDGVLCLFEKSRPMRAKVHEHSISFDHGTSNGSDQKVIAYGGTRDLARTLVAVRPGTKLTMRCNKHDFIEFHYQLNGQVKATKTGGKAKVQWKKGAAFSATGSTKIRPTSHKRIDFSCWDL